MTHLITRRQHLSLLGAACATPFLARQSLSKTTHEVQMLNHHPDNDRELMVFFPDLIRVQPGDTVRFLSVDNNHNCQSFRDMLPAGVERWKSTIGKDFDLTLETEGGYGFYCTPHQSYGMVGLILVGDVSSNFEALKTVRQRGKSRGRFADIFARADALLAGEA